MVAGECLFLAEWEAGRVHAHAERRKQAENLLCNLQLRTTSGSSSLDAWLTILETRRKLEEIAAGSALRAVDELEALWRPQRLDASDGEAAQWLVASERANAVQLKECANRWGSALPNGSADLRKRHVQMSENLLPTAAPSSKGVVCHVRNWDEAHVAVEQAWQDHSARLEAADVAIAEDHSPPDIWLSEVRYREVARAHVASMVNAECHLRTAASALDALEADRAAFWNSVAASYSQANQANSQDPPSLRLASSVTDCLAVPQLPELPSASGAVLQRLRVSIPAEKGMFGIGGGGWQDGCTLVLTLHGYLHVFGGASSSAPVALAKQGADAQVVASATSDTATASSCDPHEEELVESAIKASVYVPMAVRCVFLRKGKECSVDLAEAEMNGSLGKEQGGLGSGLRRWLSSGGAAGSNAKPTPRKVQARVADEAEFATLERRCHEFVRRGQSLRQNAASAETAQPH